MKPKDTVETNPQLAQRRRDLFRAILKLESVQECERFFADLCTPAELAAMADRWTVALWLDEEVPYREIHEGTSVSTTTVTRVARTMRHGAGGYEIALDRTRKSEER